MKKVIICVNRRNNPAQPSCAARGSEALAAQLEQEITARRLPIRVERFLCLGCCTNGPNLKLVPGGKLLNHVEPSRFDALIEEIETFIAQD